MSIIRPSTFLGSAKSLHLRSELDVVVPRPFHEELAELELLPVLFLLALFLLVPFPSPTSLNLCFSHYRIFVLAKIVSKEF